MSAFLGVLLLLPRLPQGNIGLDEGLDARLGFALEEKHMRDHLTHSDLWEVPMKASNSFSRARQATKGKERRQMGS